MRLSAITVLLFVASICLAQALAKKHKETASPAEQLGTASNGFTVDDQAPQSSTNEVQQSVSDIIINSLDDEQAQLSKSPLFESKTKGAGTSASETNFSASSRHRYDESTNNVGSDSTTTTFSTTTNSPTESPLAATTSADFGQIVLDSRVQIEPRNEIDVNSELMTSTGEPLILDHRPQESGDYFVPSSTQSPVSSSTGQPVIGSSTTTTTTTSPYGSIQAHQQQQQARQISSAASSFAPATQWQPSGPYFAPNGQGQQQANFNGQHPIQQQPAHPTSINSIISEQQQQQQQQGGSQQVVAANGQPTPVILLGQSANGQMTAMASSLNGRRISISNWFRGLSTMLANIFNRREHGGQMQASGSAPAGHWIQLGPNAPHWLTQAQSAIQQFQQQHATSGPGRLANLIQGAQTPAQFATSQLVQQPSGIANGQASSAVAIALPKAQQQQQSSAVASGIGSDSMQTSGSSINYLMVQPAPAGMVVQQATGYQAGSSPHYIVGPIHPSSPAHLVASAQQLAGQVKQLTAQQQQSAGEMSTATSGNRQQQAPNFVANAQVAVQPTMSGNSGNYNGQQETPNHQHSRTGRSSSSVQQLKSNSTNKTSGQQRTQTVTQTSGNLPLAHYSTQYTMATNSN